MQTTRCGRIVAYGLFVLMTALVVSCGGKGSTAVPPPTPSPSPTPTSGQATVTISTVNSTTATFAPIAGGDSASITFAPGTNPATLAVGFTLTEPPGVPIVQNVRRLPQRINGTGLSVLAYITVTPNTMVSFIATPSFTLTLPGSATNLGTFAYVASFDPNDPSLGWQLGPGPAMASSNTLAFTGKPAALTLIGNDTYDFAFFSVTTPLLVQ